MAKSSREQKEEKKEKSSFGKEFLEFISRGNVVELAVGLTVGVAFTNVVNSLVDNIVLPIIGAILKGEAFQNLFVSLDGKTYNSLADAQAASAPIIKYGAVISDFIDFIIIAFVIFLVIKFLAKANIYKTDKDGK